jgi:hypothetical protein
VSHHPRARKTRPDQPASSDLGATDISGIVVLVVPLVRVLIAVPRPAISAAAVMRRPAVPPTAAAAVRRGVPAMMAALTTSGGGVVILVVIVVLVVLVLTIAILRVPVAAALMLVEIVAYHLLHWAPDRPLRAEAGAWSRGARYRTQKPARGALAKNDNVQLECSFADGCLEEGPLIEGTVTR